MLTDIIREVQILSNFYRYLYVNIQMPQSNAHYHGRDEPADHVEPEPEKILPRNGILTLIRCLQIAANVVGCSMVICAYYVYDNYPQTEDELSTYPCTMFLGAEILQLFVCLSILMMTVLRRAADSVPRSLVTIHLFHSAILVYYVTACSILATIPQQESSRHAVSVMAIISVFHELISAIAIPTSAAMADVTRYNSHAWKLSARSWCFIESLSVAGLGLTAIISMTESDRRLFQTTPMTAISALMTILSMCVGAVLHRLSLTTASPRSRLKCEIWRLILVAGTLVGQSWLTMMECL